jgi:hypothetical protein
VVAADIPAEVVAVDTPAVAVVDTLAVVIAKK